MGILRAHTGAIWCIGLIDMSIQWSPSVVDTNGTYHCVQYTVEPSVVDTNGTYHCVQYTVEPLCSGHPL